MKPFFSIIIPYHNSEATIGALLDSIQASLRTPPLEVIIVDDGSENVLRVDSSWFIEKKKKLRTMNYELRTIRLQVNLGPGAARNRGAKVAKGKFLLFLDSDVRLFPDALHNLWTIFTDDPDVVAVTGVWAKHQKSQAFFPNFKALRDWSYWINERDKSGYYFLFSTRIASIKRAVFDRLGGFDEKYTGALVEDIEFTYRIARRYAIIFAPNVRVHHEFEGFWPIAKKYFWRAYHWIDLYSHRKRFDPVATTSMEAVTALSGVGVVCLGIIVFMYSLFPLIYNLQFTIYNQFFKFQISNFKLFTAICYFLFAILLIHLFLIRKFLYFVYKEKGIVFAVKSFFVGLVLYCFIVAGTVWGKMKTMKK